MKILTGSGWVTAFLESVNLNVEKESNIVRVEMGLLFEGKDAGPRAASAIPQWVVYFDDHLNDGEKMLKKALREEKADTLEERVAEEMMGVPPGGVIMVESMTEEQPQVVGTSFQQLSGARRSFFGRVADRRAKVIGHFVGKGEA